MRRLLRARVLLSPVLFVMIAWGAGALWFDGPALRPLAGALAGAFLGGSVWILTRIESTGKSLGLFLLLFVVLVGWWSTLRPRQDRDWIGDVARTAHAKIEGDIVTFHNVRNFTYRTNDDFDERWETRTFDLEKLEGVDFILCYWGPRLVAHVIVTFVFSDGKYLPISIETRKEKGEEYSAVRGFFRQFEMYYVVGDERDLIRVRTNVRDEQVFLYRLKTTKEEARGLLLEYIAAINALHERPHWYNALTNNCTTAIRNQAKHVVESQWDIRILINGHIDELGYERGTIDTSMPFPKLRERSNITKKAIAADKDPDFSNAIRAGLPNPRKK